MQNPHDKFFKATFSNVEVVKDFIIHFMPPPIKKVIDLTSIQPQKDSFIDENLQEYFSDMLFQTKINNKPAYVYLLFEHKSYVDNNISLQLLQYMLEIWKAKREKENAKTLPIVMPIVLYHGREKWSVPSSLGELLEDYNELPKAIQKYVPDFEYFLYDVSNYQDKEMKLNVQLRILLLMFRDIHKQDQEEILDTIYRSVFFLHQLEDQKTAIQYLETLMRYIFHANRQLTKANFHDMITYVEHTYSEGSEMVMTLAEIFREEGKKQGKKEGLQAGKTEALANTAIRLITKFVAPVPEDLKRKMHQQEISTLETIIDHIDEFKTIAEVEQYLK